MILAQIDIAKDIANYGLAVALSVTFIVDITIARPREAKRIAREQAKERSELLAMFIRKDEEDRRLRHETNSAINTMGLALYSLKELIQATKLRP